MNKAILQRAIQYYLREHIQVSPAEMALRKSPFEGVTASELASQLDGMQRARKKIPLWYHTEGIYYAPLLASEQASSAPTAQFKASLLQDGDSVIDLTGGFGVDSHYFSLRAREVVYCEQQADLATIAAHNALQLGAGNITTVIGDGIAYLSQQQNDCFDIAFIDPSRRVKSQKVFKLSDCEPDIVEHQAMLFQKCPRLLLKAAPLLDISLALKELKNVKDIYIISASNETKELLFLMERGHEHVARYHAIALKGNCEWQDFTFQQAEEQAAMPHYNAPLTYLYEPDSALLKAGCFKLIAMRFQLSKLHPHTHLYTSTVPAETFIGRQFRVIETMPYSIFKKEKKGIRANVACRNFPLKPDVLRQKHKLNDGGDLYLFFCTGPSGELLVIFCRKQ